MNSQSIISMLIICTGWAAGVNNPQGNNPVCGPCSSYGLRFDGPLEYTSYPEPLNVGSQNPGKIYVVYSVIDEESRPWWTQAKFGPQDIVHMTQGPLPYYVEGTAAWLQVENVDYNKRLTILSKQRETNFLPSHRVSYLPSRVHFFSMCATCGCGVDLGSTQEVFAKNYRCQECSLLFRGFGYKLPCPRCKSTNTKISR